MAWQPSNDFEEEVVNMQPDYNFIYGALCEPEVNYPRPQSHVDFAMEKKPPNVLESKQNGKLNIIIEVQKIARTLPLGQAPTINDWDTHENVERETIAMMRHFGMGSSVDQPLDPHSTIGNHTNCTKDVIWNKGRRRYPVFLDEKYFKFNSGPPMPVVENEDPSTVAVLDNDDPLPIPSFGNLSLKTVMSDKSISSNSFRSNGTTGANAQKNKHCRVKYLELKKTSADNSWNDNRNNGNTTDYTNQIPTTMWYRSDYRVRRGKKSKNTKKNNGNSAHPQNTDAAKTKFLSAKEVYDKKRTATKSNKLDKL